MNVKQALERLKAARAYTGEPNLYRTAPTATPHIRYHGRPGAQCPACAELDAQYKAAVNTLESVTTTLREESEQHRRSYQVSHMFRARADKNWEGSYTKRVVDKLRGIHPSRQPQLRFGPISKEDAGKALDAAIELLADYHHTMHPIYELAAQRLAANETLVEKLRNMGGLSNTHIHASTYEALLPSIRRMKPGDSIGQLPAQTLLAKIAQLEYQAEANSKILDRVNRAEAGELDAVKSRDEARKLQAISDARVAYLRNRLDSMQQTLSQRSLHNLPRYSINTEHEFVETVNATPDSPRKAVHGDIYPIILLHDVRLSYQNLAFAQRAARPCDFPSPEAMARHAFKNMQSAYAPKLADAAVERAKVGVVGKLQSLKLSSYHATAATLATDSIERLIDAKFDSRRYQK